MPRYTYHCYRCECVISVWHSIKESKTKCTSCEAEGLVRVPQTLQSIKQKKSKDKQKVGDVVKSSIESFREDLKEEKENLKNQEYEKNEMGIRRIRCTKFNINNDGNWRTPFLFFLSLTVNIALFWYVFSSLREYRELEEDISSMLLKTFELEEHLVSVYQMEMFYGDQTLHSLVEHTKDVVTELEVYRHKYSLDGQPLLEEEEDQEE